MALPVGFLVLMVGFPAILVLVDVAHKLRVWKAWPTDSLADMVLASLVASVGALGRYHLSNPPAQLNAVVAWLVILLWAVVVWELCLELGKYLEGKKTVWRMASYLLGVVLFSVLALILQQLGIHPL